MGLLPNSFIINNLPWSTGFIDKYTGIVTIESNPSMRTYNLGMIGTKVNGKSISVVLC